MTSVVVSAIPEYLYGVIMVSLETFRTSRCSTSSSSSTSIVVGLINS